ncbi:MAG: Na+/H+ antiporter subunit G [Acidovorax sp. SCN 68-22]|jgi:multicomponent K+:H+ antiporter subunit G|nr:MAG: Na+/H+ antiporter subunit G [Acidovorax sp. SCN 68-22]
MSTLPLWADILVSVLVLAGAAIALVGSFNLVRLANFFERVHAPAVIATLGCWCVMYGTVLYFSLQNHTVAAHGMLIAVFLAVTVPVTNIFLMRTGLFRARLAGQDMPAQLSRSAEPRAAGSLPPGQGDY